jgi:hypothetical protein
MEVVEFYRTDIEEGNYHLFAAAFLTHFRCIHVSFAFNLIFRSLRDSISLALN